MCERFEKHEPVPRSPREIGLSESSGDMMSYMETKELSKVLVPVLKRHEYLVGAYLFGSRVKGDAHPGSDLDIGVLSREPIPLTRLIRIQGDVEDAVGLRVDLVDLRSASAFLALDIVRGVRILCRDAVWCDEFELFVLSRAGDLEPFERQRRESLLGGAAP